MTSYNICEQKWVLRLRNVRGTVSDHAVELPHAKMILYPEENDDPKPA